MNEQISFQITAPAGTSSEKRDDVKLLEQGPNVGILYSIIDLGTHYNPHFNKSNRLIRLTFEFPLLKQLFRVDDTEYRSTVVSMEETFQMSEKSNLKKFVDGALGRILQPHEYQKGYDIGQFLNKIFIVQIVNRASKKDPNVYYNNIASVQAVTPHTRSIYNIDWSLVERTQDLQGFLIDQAGACFQSETFAKLPKFLRDKIMDSSEAKDYASRGGKFREAETTNKQPLPQVHSTPQANQPLPPGIQRAPQMPQAPQVPQVSQVPIFELIDTTFTKEQWNAAGWSDQALVEHGKAKFIQPAPPTPPMPPQAPPMPPQVPQAPPVAHAPIMPPQVPQAPQVPITLNSLLAGEVDGLAF